MLGQVFADDRVAVDTEDEPVASQFEVLDDGVRCVYCDTIIREDLTKHILA